MKRHFRQYSIVQKDISKYVLVKIFITLFQNYFDQINLT